MILEMCWGETEYMRAMSARVRVVASARISPMSRLDSLALGCL